VARYRDGVLPAPGPDGEAEAEVRKAADQAYAEAAEAMGDLAYDRALASIWRLVQAANGYISDRKPWELAKAGQDEELNTVLVTAAESLRVIALLSAPWLTKAAPALWHSIGGQGKLVDQRLPEALAWGGLPAGTAVTKSPALFPRLDADGKVAGRS